MPKTRLLTESALVVIDMQTRFLCRDGEGDDDPVVHSVVKNIEEAKRQNITIFSVTYSGMGDNCPAVTRALQGYEKVVHVEKFFDDGSHEIECAVRKCDLKISEFVLVGVNLGYCVLGTCDGLRKKGRKAVINRKSTNDKGEHRVTEEFFTVN